MDGYADGRRDVTPRDAMEDGKEVRMEPERLAGRVKD